VFEAVRFSVTAVSGGPDEEQIRGAEEMAADICRSVARDVFTPYLGRHSKNRWCDKSLVSVDSAEVLLTVFPSARFVCLYRDFRDVVASTLEACPFGVAGYAVDGYIRDTPGNSVCAVARYWVDKVETMCAFEQAHPDQTYRLRYEDFVSAPDVEFQRLCHFIGCSEPPASLSHADVLHRSAAFGPQDYKILYTHEVSRGSVGRGWAIPTQFLPDMLVARIDAVNGQLKYAPARDGVVHRDRFADDTPRAPGVTTLRYDTSEEVMIRHVRPRLELLNGEAAASARTALIRIVDTDVRWRLDLDARSVSRDGTDAEGMILIDEATIVDLANGDINPGVAARHNRFIVEGLGPDSSAPMLRRLSGLGDVVLALLAQEPTPHSDCAQRPAA